MKRRAQIFGVVRRKIQFLGDKCLKWRVKSVKLIYFLKDFRYLEFHKIIEKIKIFSMYFGGKKGGILVIPAKAGGTLSQRELWEPGESGVCFKKLISLF